MAKLEVHLNKEYLCSAYLEGDHMKSVSVELKSFIKLDELIHEDRIIVRGESLEPGAENKKTIEWINITPQINDVISIRILDAE